MRGIENSDVRRDGATARQFREETAEDRATYQKWLRATIVFYGALLSIGAIVAVVGYSSVAPDQLTSLSRRPVAALLRAD